MHPRQRTLQLARRHTPCLPSRSRCPLPFFFLTKHSPASVRLGPPARLHNPVLQLSPAFHARARRLSWTRSTPSQSPSIRAEFSPALCCGGDSVTCFTPPPFNLRKPSPKLIETTAHLLHHGESVLWSSSLSTKRLVSQPRSSRPKPERAADRITDCASAIQGSKKPERGARNARIRRLPAAARSGQEFRV